MELVRYVRTLGAVLVLGLAVLLIGCGWGAQQGPSAQDKEASEAHAQPTCGIFHQQLNPMKKGGGLNQGGGVKKSSGGASIDQYSFRKEFFL